MQIKVCGLSHLNEIQQLIDLEIDYLGFIFYPKSQRYVLNFLKLEEINAIQFNRKIGVFVNELPQNMIQIANKAGLYALQLHGDESVEDVKFLKESTRLQIIKVFRISADTQNLQSKIERFSPYVDAFLFDTDSKAYGGTGQVFDWEILNDIQTDKTLMLSGGLSLENQYLLKNSTDKIQILDLNSKFEDAPARKNIEKIKIYKQKLNTIINEI